MKINKNILAMLSSLALLASGGCLGNEFTTTEAPTPGPGLPQAGDATPSGAAQQFALGISTKLSTDCGGAGCHEGGVAGADFLGAPGQDDDYTTITNAQYKASALGNFQIAQARIVLKLEEGHLGKTFSDADQVAIDTWFAAEVGAAGGGGTGDGTGGGTGDGTGGVEPPPAVVGAGLRGFAQCLTLQDITEEYIINNQAYALDNITGKGTNNNNETCQNCHDGGLNGNLMAVDDGVMLAILKEAPEGLWRADIVNGVESTLPAFEKLDRFGNGQAQNQANNLPVVSHPIYNNIYPGGPGNQANIDPYMQVLQNVTEKVVARQTAGQCVP